MLPCIAIDVAAITERYLSQNTQHSSASATQHFLFETLGHVPYFPEDTIYVVLFRDGVHKLM
jgi:hypothetical protein